MFAFAYPAKLTVGSDGRVLVEVVDLPCVGTDGKHEREALEEAMDAFGSGLSIRLSRREEIPSPSAAKRKNRLVPVPLRLAPKVALWLAMRDQEVNNSELVRRILDPRRATKPEMVQAALAVLGKQMTLEVRDAV
jgi:antitoxin HicB